MRKAAKDFQLGDYRVPEGTPLLLPLTHLALNDPRFADDEPAAFKPERMLTPEGLKPGALMPFGHGPRFCAGYSVAMAEMKVRRRAPRRAAGGRHVVQQPGLRARGAPARRVPPCGPIGSVRPGSTLVASQPTARHPHLTPPPGRTP